MKTLQVVINVTSFQSLILSTAWVNTAWFHDSKLFLFTRGTPQWLSTSGMQVCDHIRCNKLVHILLSYFMHKWACVFIKPKSWKLQFWDVKYSLSDIDGLIENNLYPPDFNSDKVSCWLLNGDRNRGSQWTLQLRIAIFTIFPPDRCFSSFWSLQYIFQKQ